MNKSRIINMYKKRLKLLLLVVVSLILNIIFLSNFVFSIDNLEIWEADSMTKVGLNDNAESFDGKVEITAAKNENENFQLVLTPTQNFNDVEISISDLIQNSDTISNNLVSIYQVGYISTIDRDQDYNDVDYGMLPDPLIPINSEISLDSGNNQPIWFKIRIPKTSKAGLYAGTITLSANSEIRVIPIELLVYDFALPQNPSLQSQFGVTSSASESFSKFYNQDTYNEKLELLKKFYDKFAENRLNPINIAFYYLYDFWDAFTFDCVNEELTDVDFTLMDPIYEYCADTLEFKHIRFPITNTNPVRWDRQNDVGCKDYSWNNYQLSDEFKKVQKEYIDLASEHFEQKGWMENSVVYLTDEPCAYTQSFDYPSSHPSYSLVRQYYNHIKESNPKLKWVQTENVEPSLYEHTDLWIPGHKQYSEFDADERRIYGQEAWWYNVGSRIQTPGVKTRAILWDSYSRNVDGILDWGVNYWTYFTVNDNPWDGTSRGGDGYLLYPGTEVGIENDFVTSIRWENLGDGMEDYEYLKLLEAKYDKNFVRGLSENIAKGSYFANNRYETVTSFELVELREKIAGMIMENNNFQTYFETFASFDNLDTTNNIQKRYEQEGKIMLDYSESVKMIDDFESGSNWNPSNNQAYTDSQFVVSNEYSIEGTNSGKFSFRRTGASNSGGCYNNNWNIRIYMDNIPTDWADYDHLEFDIMPKEMTFQNLQLHTNFGFSERIGYYSLNGTTPDKWHHVKIDLSDYDLDSVTTFGFIMHTGNMEITNQFYDFYIDNIFLRKEIYETSGEIISKPIQLSGVTEYNSIEWVSDISRSGTDLRIYTSTSSNGNTWSAWEEITYDSNGLFKGTINSPDEDYIKYKIEFISDSDNSPTLSDVSINYNGDNPCENKNDGYFPYSGFVCCNEKSIYGDCCENFDCIRNDDVCNDNNFCTELFIPPCTSADTSSPIGEITNDEMNTYIEKWIDGDVSIQNLLNVIDKWKNEC
jgi:hypothetical protein